jgi:GT2 family glycosyltransferase
VSADVRLTVVIPVRDDARRLEGCLQSLSAQPRGTDVPVIVADNGSKDDTPDVARRHGATVLPLPRLSVAQMRNRAVAHATTPLVALVDADHVLAPGWLDAGLAALADLTVAAAGAPYDAPNPGTWVQRAYDRFRSRPTRREEVDWLGSGNMVIRREVFTGLGGFDERLETCEDVDLCNRIRAAGLRLVAEPGMRSLHLGDPATLKALFLSELWRGRDNIRVSLRGPLTLRALPSLLTPIAVLAALVLVVVGLASLALTMGGAPAAGPGMAATGWRMLGGGVSLIAAAIMLRAFRMSRRNTRSFADALGNVAVAAVYEVARALALVARASHGTRRRGEGRTA